MTDKEIGYTIIYQLKKVNTLLEEILKEMKKENETSIEDAIPELLEKEKDMPFAYVVMNGYVYTFCYGHCIECKQATAKDCYMYRNASEKQGK